MGKRSPVVGTVSPTRRPVVLETQKGKPTWSFSFHYFKQIDYFGLGEMQSKWFVSLFERLKDLGGKDIDTFFKDHALKDANRYHKIDWNATNIPIARTEIDWVDKEIIENEVDFPFFQFQISTGLGRVIGFWAPNYTCFHIVLLDPKHNMQPSKNYGYRIEDTTVEHGEFASLLMDIDRIKGLNCLIKGCKCKGELNKIPTNLNRGKFVYFQLDDDYYQEFLQQTQNKSVKEIIELGLLRD